MRTVILQLFMGLLPFVAAVSDPVIGDKVFVKDGVKAKSGDSTIDGEQLSFPATVEDVDGELLWLMRGWVHKLDVMTADEALAFYNEQILLQPKNAKAWRCRGSVWATKGELDKSNKDYSEATRLDPTNARAYSNRGTNWAEEGQYDLAIGDYDAAIRNDPMYAQAYINRGSAFSAKGEYKKAISDYNTSIRLDPTDPMSFVGRGGVWLQLRKYDKATVDFNEAIRLDGKYDEAYGNRAFAWHRTGKYAKAIDDYETAIRLRPMASYPYDALAYLLATCPNHQYRNGKKAVELATRSCELTKWKVANNIAVLAAASAEARDWKNAIKWQMRFIEMVNTECDKRDGSKLLALYEQRKPYRDLIESSPSQLFWFYCGLIVVGVMLTVVVIGDTLFVLPYRWEQRIAQEIEAAGGTVEYGYYGPDRYSESPRYRWKIFNRIEGISLHSETITSDFITKLKSLAELKWPTSITHKRLKKTESYFGRRYHIAKSNRIHN